MNGTATNGGSLKLVFNYDYMGRRIQKAVVQSGSTNLFLKFVYDGWNLLGELNATNNAVVRTYVWGKDLSGSLQGAGGVGGLLAAKESSGTAHFAAYDGNGNVMGLVDGTSGAVSAQYEYDPFGGMIRQNGSMAEANLLRFSTKYTDQESGYLYYGYRYYSPNLGRWISRDPLNEEGGINRYAYTENSPIEKIDLLGLVVTRTGGGAEVVGGVIKTKQYRGVPVKGLIVGKHQYPRAGMCGCWERNYYADFTPVWTFGLKHHKQWATYQDDFSPEADMLEIISDLSDFSEPDGPPLKDLTGWAGLAAKILANWKREIDTITWTVHQEFDQWDPGNIDWEMGKIGFKAGQSTKISDKTCKARDIMLSKDELKALTRGRGADFSNVTIKYLERENEKQWITE